jgi:hypothetical protein
MKADDLAKLPNPLKPTYVIDGFPMPQRIVPGRLGKRHVRLTEPPPFPLTEPQYFTRPAVLLLIGPPFVDPAQTTGAGIIEETHLGRQARPKPPQEAPVRATPGELRPSHRTKARPKPPHEARPQPAQERSGPATARKPRPKPPQESRSIRPAAPGAAARSRKQGSSARILCVGQGEVCRTQHLDDRLPQVGKSRSVKLVEQRTRPRMAGPATHLRAGRPRESPEAQRVGRRVPCRGRAAIGPSGTMAASPSGPGPPRVVMIRPISGSIEFRGRP